MPTDAIECPLCLGDGKLKRTEVLDRLGVKDFARVAQLSAEEAFRLLLEKHKEDQQHIWVRFESEIQRVRLGLEDKLRFEQSQKEHLNRRVEDHFREISQLRVRNQELETEMAKVARVGRLEELSFADEARTWSGIEISPKLPRNGDFILAFRDPSGAPLEPRMVVDTKDKESGVTEADIKKLIRDAKERNITVGIIVAKDECQLRQIDRECRWGQEEDGVWVLRTTRRWLPRDLEVLRPLLERMRTEGPDFLQRNAALAEEVRRTFADIDAIEKELGKASKAIQSVSGLVAKYKGRLERLCESPMQNKPSRPATVSSNDLQSAGA